MISLQLAKTLGSYYYHYYYNYFIIITTTTTSNDDKNNNNKKKNILLFFHVFAGMGVLAEVFKDDKERGRAMGISFTGLALGLIGVYMDTDTLICTTKNKEFFG